MSRKNPPGGRSSLVLGTDPSDSVSSYSSMTISRNSTPVKPSSDTYNISSTPSVPDQTLHDSMSWKDNRNRSTKSDIFAHSDVGVSSPFMEPQKIGNKKNISSISFGGEDPMLSVPTTGRRRGELSKESSGSKIFGAEFDGASMAPGLSRRTHKLDSDIFGSKGTAAKAAEPIAKNDVYQNHSSYNDYDAYSNSSSGQHPTYETYPNYGDRFENDYEAKYLANSHDSYHPNDSKFTPQAKEESSYIPNEIPHNANYAAGKVSTSTNIYKDTEPLIPTTPSSNYANTNTPNSASSRYSKSSVFDFAPPESSPVKNRRHFNHHYGSAPDLIGDASTTRNTQAAAGRRAGGSASSSSGAPFATSNDVVQSTAHTSRRNNQTFDIFGGSTSDYTSGAETSNERAFGLSSSEMHRGRVGKGRYVSQPSSQIIFGP